MHFAFIPYGIKNMVDFCIDSFNHRFVPLKLYKEGEEDKFILIQTQVRVLPFGIYELVFPKELQDEVFSAFKFQKEYKEDDYMGRLNKSIMGIKPMDLLRKALKLEPMPEFKKVDYPHFPMPEYKRFVSIIPIGVRYDGEITEPSGPYEGWKHEGI
jgi:hypothetical protein